MAIVKVEGIVISEVSYGETSKILNLITRDYGIIGVISKGCKTLKSSLRSVSTKLTYGYFNINYKEGKLSNLISVDVIDNLKNIKTDITLKSISYSTFILELSEQVLKHNALSDIFDLMISSILKINEGFDPLVITNIVELKYLKYLGVMPVIDCCCVCGNKENIKTLSSKRGGYVCDDCYSGELVVSNKAIKLIRMLYYVDISKISKLDVSLSVKMEVNMFLDEYYDLYTGLFLKSKKFIEDLEK